MKLKYFSNIISLLFLVVISTNSTAQIIKDPEVTITDQSGSKKPIITCDYDFNSNTQKNCLTLTATYPDIKNATQYSVESITYEPFGNFTEGTEIPIVKKDDYWSSLITLPFNFCLYGKSFSSMIISDNGSISFNTPEDAGAKAPYNIPSASDGISSVLSEGKLLPYSIYGAFHDLVMDPDSFECTSSGGCGKITMYTTGTAPFRKVIINYNGMNHYNCNNIKSTFQIVLYESINIIDIYVKQKPPSCENGKSEKYQDVALIAIIDENGNGLAPAGRDDISKWNTNASGSEAWRFSPKGESNPIIKWYDADFKIIEEGISNNGKNIEVCPTATTTYHVEVTYNTCGLESLTSSIPITFDYQFPAANPVTENYCYDGKSTISKDFKILAEQAVEGNLDRFNYYFYNIEDDAIADIKRVSGIVSMNKDLKSKVLYLRVENKNNNNCFSVVPLTIYLRAIPTYNNEVLELCGIEGQPYVINNIVRDGLLPISDSGWITLYFNTLQEAQNYTEGGSIKPINQLSFPVPPSSMVVYLRAYNKYVPECSTIVTPVTIMVNPALNLSGFTHSECTSFAFDDDLTEYVKGIPDYEDYTFTYYTNLSDAYEGINAISDDPNTYPRTTKYPVYPGLELYFRIDNFKDGYCPPVGPIKYNLKTSKINIPLYNFCDSDGTGYHIVDLEEYFNQAKGNIIVSNVKFYDKNGLIAPDKVNSYPLSETSDFTVTYTEDGCEFSTKFRLNFIKRIDAPSSYQVCDLQGDGVENFKLSPLASVFPYYNGLVTYYLTEEDAQSKNNPVSQITLKKGTDITIYVRVVLESNSFCIIYHKITLQLVDKVFAETYNYTAKLCDHNLDDKEVVNLTNYEEFLINVPSLEGYSFRYYLSYKNAVDNTNPIKKPEEFLVENFSEAIIYVRISDSSACSSIVELTFENTNFIEADNITVYICDKDSNGYEDGINLENIVKDMNASSGVKISYHETEKDANESSISTITKDPGNYSITSTTYIWVRFENEACYTVRHIELNLESIPKPRPATYYICDDNLDGIYTLNTEDVKKLNFLIIDDNTEDYTFIYYIDPYGTQEINLASYPFNSLPVNVYVKAVKNGCESPIITVALATQAIVPINPVIPEVSSCDDNFDGITTFDLGSTVQQLLDPAFPLPANPEYSIYETYADAQEKINPKNINNYVNIQPNADQVFVRINSSSYCPAIGVINLKVLPVPVSSLPEEYKICANGTVTLDTNTGITGDYYEWSSGEKGIDLNEITVNKTGTYSVTITGAEGCKYTYSTKVTEYPKITITGIITGDDYIMVNAEGPQPLEYSKNNIDWQSSNVFSNLKPGIFTLYVRSSAIPCDPVTAEAIIFESHVNNLITPNNDGHNDVWTLCGLDLFNGEKSLIKIFDRYGKTVFEEKSNTCFIWNGYYSGRPLPTSSYWYIINFPDGRESTGWILLKNYNELK